MKEINDKQKLFCELYVQNWYNGSEAYSVAYEQKNPQAAATWASQLMKKEAIRKYIDVVEWNFKLTWYTCWIDKKTLLWVLKEMLWAVKANWAPDWWARNNAVITIGRLTWYLSWDNDSAKDLLDDEWEKKTNSISEMTEEEKEIYKKKLLESL